jgi:hypothetical protein
MRCKAKHLCSPSQVFVFLSIYLTFFLSRRTHQNFIFSGAMTSTKENQRIVVQTRDENIDIEGEGVNKRDN